MRQGHIQRYFCPSFFHIVYFLHKFAEFHVTRMECQRIIFCLLLLLSHKYPAIAKLFPLPYSLLIFANRSLLLCYSVDGINKGEAMIYIKRRGVT